MKCSAPNCQAKCVSCQTVAVKTAKKLGATLFCRTLYISPAILYSKK